MYICLNEVCSNWGSRVVNNSPEGFPHNGIMMGSSNNITAQPLIMFLHCITGWYGSYMEYGPVSMTEGQRAGGSSNQVGKDCSLHLNWATRVMNNSPKYPEGICVAQLVWLYLIWDPVWGADQLASQRELNPGRDRLHTPSSHSS